MNSNNPSKSLTLTALVLLSTSAVPVSKAQLPAQQANENKGIVVQKQTAETTTAENKAKPKTTEVNNAQSPVKSIKNNNKESFIPTEAISEDLAVSFPIDI